MSSMTRLTQIFTVRCRGAVCLRVGGRRVGPWEETQLLPVMAMMMIQRVRCRLAKNASNSVKPPWSWTTFSFNRCCWEVITKKVRSPRISQTSSACQTWQRDMTTRTDHSKIRVLGRRRRETRLRGLTEAWKDHHCKALKDSSTRSSTKIGFTRRKWALPLDVILNTI